MVFLIGAVFSAVGAYIVSTRGSGEALTVFSVVFSIVMIALQLLLLLTRYTISPAGARELERTKPWVVVASRILLLGAVLFPIFLTFILERPWVAGVYGGAMLLFASLALYAGGAESKEKGA